MAQLEDLLDEQTRARLMEVAQGADKTTVVLADLDPEAPAQTEPEVPYVIVKAATDPNPPRTLTAADAIDIDPRSGAFIDALCVDCQVPLLIDPKVPEGVDPEKPRIPMCDGCAKVRARFAAMSEQRNVEIIRRSSTKKRSPRTTDGIDHPVTVTTKEKPMPKTDLDNLSDAELGAMVRTQLKATATEQIKEAAPKVEAERKERDKATTKATAKKQKQRKNNVLPGFRVDKSLEVPDLDLSDIDGLDECVSATTRSPYNKARFRLKAGDPLDPETTTYAVLADEHQRLRELASIGKDTEGTTVVLAVNDSDEVLNTKAKALAKVLGVSKKEAKAIVLSGA